MLDRLPKRFRKQISVCEHTNCWNWHGQCINRRGRYSNEYTHRYTYKRLVGPIPPTMTIDHLCKNPLCCNPTHLEAVPMSENTRRYIEAPYRHLPVNYFKQRKPSKKRVKIDRRKPYTRPCILNVRQLTEDERTEQILAGGSVTYLEYLQIVGKLCRP